MIELKETSEKRVRREVYKFDQEYGTHYFMTNTWTRVTVDGELSKWIPHDGYGELPESSASAETEDKLESLYQNSEY